MITHSSRSGCQRSSQVLVLVKTVAVPFGRPQQRRFMRHTGHRIIDRRCRHGSTETGDLREASTAGHRAAATNRDLSSKILDFCTRNIIGTRTQNDHAPPLFRRPTRQHAAPMPNRSQDAGSGTAAPEAAATAAAGRCTKATHPERVVVGVDHSAVQRITIRQRSTFVPDDLARSCSRRHRRCHCRCSRLPRSEHR